MIKNSNEISRMIAQYIEAMPLPGEPKGLYSPIKYTLGQGGKRLRPMLVAAACNMFSDDVEASLPAAAAVEVFHNFTLLHDDIMDNASIRRGNESVYKKWGLNTAILSGDAMLIFSYTLLEGIPAGLLPPVFREFNLLALEVCEGQQLDVDFEESDSITPDDYIKMVSLKTAALIARALNIGALLGGAPQSDRQALYEFGINLGIAFQITDDLLDSYGSQESFGKSIGGDILEGKKTFLRLEAIKAGYGDQIDTILADGSLPPDGKIAAVKQKTGEAIEMYNNAALEALSRVEVNAEHKATLCGIAASLLGRDK